MSFDEELESVLPSDLPNRKAVRSQSALHLRLIEEANTRFNLTRITGTRQAAIKHVLDSVLPWRHFAGSKVVLDAGTGAGFPGIPLALVLPATRFILSESVGKKARFVASAATALALPNVEIANVRAEQLIRRSDADLITGRALAPLDKFCVLFGAAVRSGSRALLYKGPDVEAEIESAALESRRQKLQMHVLDRYELPEAMGTRTLVEVIAA